MVNFLLFVINTVKNYLYNTNYKFFKYRYVDKIFFKTTTTSEAKIREGRKVYIQELPSFITSQKILRE